jgi:hypothetical protein
MIILADISKKEWTFKEEPLSSYHVVLNFGFNSNGKLPVLFNEMKFGYSIELDNKVLVEEKRPEQNQKYLSTDQEIIESIGIFDLLPTKEYVLNVWAEESGEFWSKSISFILPKPKQPYPSWEFDEDLYVWIAPSQPPEEDGYIWNEEKMSWVKYENEE